MTNFRLNSVQKSTYYHRKNMVISPDLRYFCISSFSEREKLRLPNFTQIYLLLQYYFSPPYCIRYFEFLSYEL